MLVFLKLWDKKSRKIIFYILMGSLSEYKLSSKFNYSDETLKLSYFFILGSKSKITMTILSDTACYGPDGSPKVTHIGHVGSKQHHLVTRTHLLKLGTGSIAIQTVSWHELIYRKKIAIIIYLLRNSPYRELSLSLALFCRLKCGVLDW